MTQLGYFYYKAIPLFTMLDNKYDMIIVHELTECFSSQQFNNIKFKIQPGKCVFYLAIIKNYVLHKKNIM